MRAYRSRMLISHLIHQAGRRDFRIVDEQRVQPDDEGNTVENNFILTAYQKSIERRS